jgi:hypothetical protein
VTASLIIGRRFVKGTTTGARLGAFFAGFGILRLIALIPGVGLLAWFVVCVYGLGAVSMAAWYGGHRPPRDEVPPPPVEPPVDEPPAAPPPIEEPATDAALGEAADEPATEEPPRVAPTAVREPPAEPAGASS